MISKILMGMALTTAVVMKDGIIEVNVQEKHRDGSHIHLYVPATVATWGVHMAPEERLKEHLRGNRENLQLARAVVQAFEKYPDADFVQVESPKEHVHMQTRGGSFVVDVDDEGETVHVAVPIRAVRKVLETNAPTS
jgi:hypothetical protein